MKNLTLSKIGDDISGGVVSGLLVDPDQSFEAGQPLFEIETDKAVVEIASQEAAVLKKWLIKSGQKINVGDAYAQVEELNAQPSTADSKPAAKEPAPAVSEQPANNAPKSSAQKAGKEKQILVPILGDNITSAHVLEIFVQVGQTLPEGQAVLELETDKATFELPNPEAGTIVAIFPKKGENIATGQPLFTLIPQADAAAKQPDPLDEPTATQQPSVAAKPVAAEQPPVSHESKPTTSQHDSASIGSVQTEAEALLLAAKASPMVRRFAREIGVDITQVPSSGKNNRITVDDVKAFSKLRLSAPVATAQQHLLAEPLPNFSTFGEVQTLALSGIKKATVVQMQKSWQRIPMVTETDKADITALEKLRKKHKTTVEKAGAKLTITAILIKVLGKMLAEFPAFNASLSANGEELIIKKYYNIGVAVDTERGLIVPVIRNVDRLSITQIALSLQEISQKARNKKIVPSDLQGSGFTLSNLGGIGSRHFTPIVNWPEVAILGVAKSVWEPVYDQAKQTFEPKLMMPLSLTFDHRVIDGAEAARFLTRMIALLEEPFLLVL